MRKIAGLFAVACAVAASPAWATNGMRMIGFGPVQESMGGAGVAAPLDAATIVSNPAGLPALGRRADLAGTYFQPTVEYDAQSASPSSPIASGATIDSDRGASYIPFVGFVWPAAEDVTLGVAAVGVSGMGVDYATDLYGGKTFTSYMNMRLAPAASYRLAKGLTAGAAVNLMYAAMEYEVAGGMGMRPRDTQGSFGYGATLGVQYAPVEMVTLGLAYESKSFFQDFQWTIAPHQVFDPGSGTMVPVPGGDEKLAFDQPQSVTVGASARPIPALLVAADVQWINWSDTNGENQPEFATNPQMTGAKAWNMNWSDQVVLKIGAEWAATSALKLRAGYDYGKMPLDAARAFENIAFPAIAEHHVTVGAGYAFGGLTVNAAAMYVPEATLTGSNAAEQGIGSYTTKMSQLAFDLGVAYRF
jgi:long-chain fatty acid transport protein